MFDKFSSRHAGEVWCLFDARDAWGRCSGANGGRWHRPSGGICHNQTYQQGAMYPLVLHLTVSKSFICRARSPKTHIMHIWALNMRVCEHFRCGGLRIWSRSPWILNGMDTSMEETATLFSTLTWLTIQSLTCSTFGRWAKKVADFFCFFFQRN